MKKKIIFGLFVLVIQFMLVVAVPKSTPPDVQSAISLLTLVLSVGFGLYILSDTDK